MRARTADPQPEGLPAELDPSAVRLHRLAFLEEDGEVVVGRADIESFGVFPPDGAALVRELAAGRSPASAATWYADTYQERVDITQFIQTLRELRFVLEDGEAADPPAQPVHWQRVGRALFSTPAWIAYATLLLAGLAVCVIDPQVRPRASNVMFSDYLLLVSATVLTGQLILAGTHELFHVLAGRRLGVRSSIRLSRRFYFLVVETNLDGLALLPRRRRVLPILAGLLCDALSFSALTVIAHLTRSSQPSLSAVCLALAFSTLPRMAWQFYVFLRTDIYYLITTLTGCVDLDAAARAKLFNIANGVLKRTDRRDLTGFHPRDLRAARWFAPLLVVGYTATLTTLIVNLPTAYGFLSNIAERVFAPHHERTGSVWDAAIFGVLVLAQLTFALTLMGRRLRRRPGRTTRS